MEQLSENPLDLLAEPGQISGLGVARTNSEAPKIRLTDRRFPGRCDIRLALDEAQQLATALRTMSQSSQATPVMNDRIGPVRVSYSYFNAPKRRVVTIFVDDFPGELRIYISDLDAQRVADELEQSSQRAQGS